MLCVLLCTKSLLSIKKFKVLLFLKMYNGRILYSIDESRGGFVC